MLEKTIDNFIISPTNNFAASGCVIAAECVDSFNPVLLYGPSGCGKTHLIRAIAGIRSNKRTLITDASDMVDVAVANIKLGFEPLDDYLKYDAVFVDNCQFLAGKDETQREIFDLIKKFAKAKKQFFIVCDCPPGEISTLYDLITRELPMGLVVDIQPPDEKLLIEYAKRACRNIGLDITHRAAYSVIDGCKTVPEVSGRIKRIRFYSKEGDTIDTEWLVRHELVKEETP